MKRTKEDLARRAAHQRAWRQRHHERVLADETKRNCSPKRKAERAEWARLNPDKIRGYKAKQRRNDPEKARAVCAAKRARRRGALGMGITAKQRQRIISDSLGLCAYCNERGRLGLDHIDPLFRGGEHDVSNAVACCKPCNSSKCDTPLLVWLATKASKRRSAPFPPVP